MTNKKNRMATSENPDDQRHTIVGGRPEAPINIPNYIPRGLEVIIKRASIDEAFKAELLQKRDSLADQLNIPLDSSERAMLGCVPESHLGKMIETVEVSSIQHKLLSSGTSAAMLALLAQLTFASCGLATNQQQIDTTVTSEKTSECNEEYLASNYAQLNRADQLSRGIRPDSPSIPTIEQPETPVDVDQIPLTVIMSQKIEIESKDETFINAIIKIEKATEITIDVQGLVEDKKNEITGVITKGLTLEKAIKNLCDKIANENIAYRFIKQEAPPTLFIYFRDKSVFKQPEQLVKPSFKINDRPSTFVKGIRSDLPDDR